MGAASASARADDGTDEDTAPSADEPTTRAFGRGRLRFRAAVAKAAKREREDGRRLTSPCGPGATLSGTSLGVFGPGNEARRWVFRAMHGERAEAVVLAIVAGHFVTLVLLASREEEDDGGAARALRATDFAVLCAYSVEAAARIFSLGLFGHKHAYLASVYNQLDALIVGVSWLSASARWRGDESLLARVRVGQLRLFRGVLALKRFKLATAVVFIAESLHKSLPLLRDVAVITVVCAVFYALMGMGIFGGSLRRRCVETTSASTANAFYSAVSDPPLFCGDTANELGHKGYVCPGVYDSNSSLFCSELVGNPEHGYQSFDSFGSTLLVMFQCVTIESWQEVMFAMINAEYKSSAAYFITLIIVGTYFIVSVFVAAVSGVFLRLRREHQKMLRSRSAGGEDEELRNQTSIRRLVRRLRGGTGETLASVVEAAMEHKELLLADSSSEPTEVPSGVARNKRERLRQYMSNVYFERAVKALIVCNIALMSMYRFDLEREKKEYLRIAEGFFIAAFAVEVVLRVVTRRGFSLRLITFGLHDEDMPVAFDMLIAGLSAMTIWGMGVNLSPFRILRLFMKDGGMKKKGGFDVIARVFRSMGSLASLLLFYVATLAMYAVFGMQIFARRDAEFADTPRLNYDTFPQAMLTLFVTSTGEGWTDMMYHGVRVTPVAIPYYITFFVLVNYVILNLVIAVVLENLELKDVEKMFIQSQKYVQHAVQTALYRHRFVDFMERTRVKMKLTMSGRRWTEERAHCISPWLCRRAEIERNVRQRTEEALAELFTADSNVDRASTEDFLVCESKLVDIKGCETSRKELAPNVVAPLLKKKTHGRKEVELIFEEIAHEVPIAQVKLPWYMSDDRNAGRIKKTFLSLINSKLYKYVSYVFIAISVFAVLATKPVGQENKHQTLVDCANMAVFGYFFIDFVGNVVARGLLLTPEPFASRVWNLCDAGVLLIDGMIVACPLILGSAYTKYWHRAFNMAAPVRPVRILTRVKPMQRLVKSLFITLPSVGSIILLTGALFLAFAVLGIREFGGTFYSCTDESVASKSDCVGTFVDASGEMVMREWKRHLFEFDWIGSAMLTLFETASLDGWTDVMFSGMDKAGVDLQPQFQHNWPAAFYFVTFILFGSFLMVRTIIGVFIHQFGIISGRKLLTERQKLWYDMNKVATSLRPIRYKAAPPFGLRRVCFAMLNHRFYRVFVLACVSVNAVIMACEQYGDDGSVFARVRATSELCFVGVYLFEAVVRLVSSYPNVLRPLSEKWNVFELVIAAGSAATLCSRKGSIRDQIGRPFRFLRIFRVIRHLYSVQILANTLMLAIPSILCVMALMMIWMFVYAGIGTQLFANVKYGETLNKDANFQSFTNSFLLLFQVITGEGWRQYMYDLMVTEPFCVDDGSTTSDCGFPDGAVLYFVTYVIAMGYIFTNLFVAAILDHVTFGVLREDAVITPAHLYDFQRVWSAFDPDATGFVGLHRVNELVHRLGAPLAVVFTPSQLRDLPYPAYIDAIDASSLWRRELRRELLASRGHDPRGVSFAAVLSILLELKLGPDALSIDARLARRIRRRAVRVHAAVVVAQAWIRGHVARKRVARVHLRQTSIRIPWPR